MTNTKAVDVSKIKQGDRVSVVAIGGSTSTLPQWATVMYEWDGHYVYCDVDDKTIYGAQNHATPEGHACYMAARGEVFEHIPANKVAMHEGRPVNVEDHGQPNPLAKVIADLTDTHKYLQQVTGKTFEAAIQGFELEVSGDYNSHSVTLRFVEKDKQS